MEILIDLEGFWPNIQYLALKTSNTIKNYYLFRNIYKPKVFNLYIVNQYYS